MSCLELSRIVGKFLRENLLHGYVFEIKDKVVEIVFSDNSIKKELGVTDASTIFRCDPNRLYLSGLPIFFDETLRENIDIISRLSIFLTTHNVGVLSLIYEKHYTKNIAVVKILRSLEGKLKHHKFTTLDKIELAILIRDLLETSKRIREIRREFKGEKDYINYQVEWETLSMLLKKIEKRISRDTLNEILTHEYEEKNFELEMDGEEIIRKAISENIGSDQWDEKSVFISPSEILGFVGENAVSVMNSLITEMLRRGIEIFFYVPSKFFFIQNIISEGDRVILV